MQLTTLDYLSILPTTILAVWAMALMLIELVVRRTIIIGWLALIGFVVAGSATALIWNQRGIGFGGMVVLDPYGLFFSLVGILAGGLAVLQSLHYVRDRGIGRGEYYALLMFSVCGITLMSSANNLIIVFIGLEILSIPLYVLAGLAWPNLQSEEAAMKYFLLGAFASGFLLFGIALVYGATGTTDLAVLSAGLTRSPLLLIGSGLLLVGLGFKVAAVPFHMWTPDVYEGAPTPITGFMSVGAKVAGFAALTRVFVFALSALQADWVFIVAFIAALTMILGNVVAIMQNNLKRMLGYSSIAHAGYILMGVAAAGDARGRELGVAGVMFYLLAYAFTNLGAFAVLAMLANKQGEDQSFNAYRGLARRNLPAAAAMAFFMLSLTGIPLTGGFTGKYYLFWSAVQSDLIWLALVGVLTSVVSAFYYLRVVIEMFMREPEGEVQPASYGTLNFSLALTTVATLILGVLPSGLLSVAQQAARLLFGTV
ncbi:MAG TPA: NADH-quinone oxidoreductase subunit N [Anaerolineae bacterium]|nr:NADH-quinone oxidoreductase subunit N [Anaerolineae bacterium]